MTNTRRSSILLTSCALFLISTVAQACNVPVFRFALERWRADPYDVVVFHRGPLNSEDQAAIQDLQESADHANRPANLEVELVDLDKQPAAAFVKLFQAQKNPELPWVVVRYPVAARIEEPVWTGRLQPALGTTLTDSPVRRELAKRLLAGETAVFVLLESGRKDADEAAAQKLENELKKLPARLKLPELSDTPADKLLRGGPPLRLAFSLLRVSRDEPAEQMLVNMLLHTEDDLPGKREPIAFPVFGRGRALYALVGAGISADNIHDAGALLTAPCSCDVKRLNPGTDLLLAAGWDAVFDEKPVLVPEPTSATVEYVPIPVAPIATVKPAEGTKPVYLGWSLRQLALLAITAAALLAAATGAWALRARKT